MAEPTTPSLTAECAVFGRYLTGRPPSAYALEKYLAGHGLLMAGAGPVDAVDRLLVRVATGGPIAARIADAYARHARPTGLLRRKLVLLLAVLESSPPTHAWINGAEHGPGGLVLLRMLGAALVSAAALAVGTVLLGPAHLLLRGRQAAREP